MIKKIIFLCFLATLTIVVGCKSEKIQVIETTNISTNKVNFSAFNDEQYVWESWLFTTNKVNKFK